MTSSQLQEIKRRFGLYLKDFAPAGGSLPPPLALKADHCRRVSNEAGSVSRDLEWPDQNVDTAVAAGLLHDIGRFTQYTEYRTFSDSLSVDHGERGAEVLEQTGLLADLDSPDCESIVYTVRRHNCLSVPQTGKSRKNALLRLIRDCDKLDIFRIVLGEVERDGFKSLPEMLAGISLERTVSSAVTEEILTDRRASMVNVKTLADFMLMQFSWIYDLNYTASVIRFRDRRILQRIIRQIESDANVERILAEAESFLQTVEGAVEMES